MSRGIKLATETLPGSLSNVTEASHGTGVHFSSVSRDVSSNWKITGNRNEAVGISLMGDTGTETSLELEQHLENCTTRAPILHRASCTDNGGFSAQYPLKNSRNAGRTKGNRVGKGRLVCVLVHCSVVLCELEGRHGRTCCGAHRQESDAEIRHNGQSGNSASYTGATVEGSSTER